jgi:hypothetical protein
MEKEKAKKVESGKVTAIIHDLGAPESPFHPSYFKFPTVHTAVSTSGLVGVSLEFAKEELIYKNSEASKILTIFEEVKGLDDDYNRIARAFELFKEKKVKSFSFHKKRFTAGCAFTPSNGLCGYLIIHQLKQRQIELKKKKPGTKNYDNVTSLDVNKPIDRIVFLQILRDYALTTSNAVCRTACEKVHEKIVQYFKPGTNVPFNLPESSNLWLNALWLPTLSLDFNRALFVSDLSANLPTDFCTLIQRNDDNDCLLNLSICEILATIERNNYFVLDSKHFSLLPTPVVKDEIDDVQEAVFFSYKELV